MDRGGGGLGVWRRGELVDEWMGGLYESGGPFY